MKQQCDSQNANPRSDSKSRDPMKSGGVAKIESESRSSSYGSGIKRSGTERNDHDTNHPPESKRIKTEQPRPDVKSEYNDDKKYVINIIISHNSDSQNVIFLFLDRIQYYLQSYHRARKRDQFKIFNIEKIEKRIIADQLQLI